MTKLLLLYFGEEVNRPCASGFETELGKVSVLPAKGNWAGGYLEWLAAVRPSCAVLPRFLAEHDYGPMPKKASLYHGGDIVFVVPGSLGMHFDWSIESYRLIWSDLLDVMTGIQEVVICLNMFCQEESASQVNSAIAFMQEMDQRTDMFQAIGGTEWSK